ncbi:MAG: hypothetical protein WC559_06180 [Candidatus Omnitrophota bacterium]
MRKKKEIALLLAGMVLGGVVLFPRFSYAEFSLSVRPYAGGYELRYDKLNVSEGRVNREVTVTINSDIAKQYRLLQTFVQPLTNNEGGRIPAKDFVVYAIRGSNRYGTMNVIQEVPLYMDRQLLYTSDTNGSQDSFVLVYGLIPSSDFAPGYYRGRLAFILEPIDRSTGQQMVNVILDVSAQIEVNSSVEIKTATGSKDIILKADEPSANSADILFNIKGRFGKQFRILQFAEQPTSSAGNRLDWKAVVFSGTDASKGTVISVATPLSAMQQPVYNSSVGGDADSFALTYGLGDISGQKAGAYRGRIKYILDGAGLAQMQLIDTLNLEIDIPRIFDIEITPADQKSALEFTNLKPESEPQRNEINIKVSSNTGKQYQVTQNLYSELKNKEGETIRSKYFTLRTEGIDTKGALKFGTPEAVKKGETVLFVSDKDGSSDEFKVIYELAPSRDLKYGDYSSAITYSLAEI